MFCFLSSFTVIVKPAVLWFYLPEYQCAVLIVKWEVGDFNGTGAAIDSWRQPVHPSIAADQDVGVVSHIKLAIDAAHDKEEWGRELTWSSFLTLHRKKQKNNTGSHTHFHKKASLVFQDDVRKPNRVVRHPDNLNAVIIAFIPGKAIIRPLLLDIWEESQQWR